MVAQILKLALWLLCSLAAHMLLLMMHFPVELLYSVASMMILILHELLNPGWEMKKELQVPHLKTVLQTLLRLLFIFPSFFLLNF